MWLFFISVILHPNIVRLTRSHTVRCFVTKAPCLHCVMDGKATGSVTLVRDCEGEEEGGRRWPLEWCGWTNSSSDCLGIATPFLPHHKTTTQHPLISWWPRCADHIYHSRGELNVSLLLPWSGLVVCWRQPAAHSRDVTVGYHQRGPGRHQPACCDESNLMLPSDSLGSDFYHWDSFHCLFILTRLLFISSCSAIGHKTTRQILDGFVDFCGSAWALHGVKCG